MSLIKNDYWILNAGVSGSVIITFISINLSILDFKCTFKCDIMSGKQAINLSILDFKSYFNVASAIIGNL